MKQSLQIDLTGPMPLPSHSYLFHQLKALEPQQSSLVILNEPPQPLMERVSHQLRHRIYWEVIDQPMPDRWHVRVCRREDVPTHGIIDILTRDHLRLDTHFAKALYATNRDDMATAEAHFRVFSRGLQRHLGIENELLAHHFELRRSERGDDPTSIMLREHDSINEQVLILEDYFARGLPSSSEVAPFFALVSGALAKHEGREEQNLFPLWQACLKQDNDFAYLLGEVEQAIDLADGL